MRMRGFLPDPPVIPDGPKDQTRNLEIPDRRCAPSGMTD
jgi:hypothetical protein